MRTLVISPRSTAFTPDDVSGKGWAADERLDYKGMVYIYKGEEVFLEVSAHALSLGDGLTR